MMFFPGFDNLTHARHFDRAFISVNTLRRRVSDFEVQDWIMDSGAFSEITRHGWFRDTPEEYAARINRWKGVGNMLAAVSQDVMCEPFILKITGKTVAEHQAIAVHHYDRIQALTDAYVMPVLQGFTPQQYVDHIAAYGDRLKPGMWVGVGSICKRNASPESVEDVLLAIKRVRPDLRLHGFGLKITALQSNIVWDSLYSADSMAWSFSARQQGRDSHDWREAARFVERINTQHRSNAYQQCLFN